MIADLGLGIRERGTWAARGRGAPNKANRPGRARQIRNPKRTRNPSAQNEAPAMPAARQTNPICAVCGPATGMRRENKANRGGPGSRSEIGRTRYEIRFTRYASTVWTECQTKPIRAEEASALMMDYRLLMIWARQWPWPEAGGLYPQGAKQTQFPAFLARK
jgi:hypothetical protein